MTLPEGSGCLIDCVIGLSGASFGEKTLNFHRQKTIRFSGQKKSYDYQLLEPGRRWGNWEDLTWEGVLALEDCGTL